MVVLPIPTADAFVARLLAAFATLADFPEMGHARDEFGPGLRSFPVENDLVFDAPREDGITIARVLSGCRDLPRYF